MPTTQLKLGENEIAQTLPEDPIPALDDHPDSQARSEPSSTPSDSRPTSAAPSLGPSAIRRKGTRLPTDDIQQYMNIQHFEQLMTIFKSHKNEDGEEGFDIETFREVFGKVLGGNLDFDQMTQLFMKIDANSDGTVSWDEFSTFVVMVGSLHQDQSRMVIDEKIRKLVDSSHKDLVKRIDYILKERKYISISRDGSICLWSPKLKLQKTFTTRETFQSWVTDAVLLHDQNKLVIISDDRQLTIYEMMSIKPRKVVTIAPLENTPLCIAYAYKLEDERSVIVYGDDGGFLNILSFTRRFFVDHVTDNDASVIKPSAILHNKDDSLLKSSITLFRKKVHNEWVEKVQCFKEINSFVTSSNESHKSLVLSDIERKTVRYISVNKGIRCFDYCKRPSFLVTGGRDKIVRLWNPYVLSRAAGSLHGHNATVTDVLINQTDAQIISLSEDKVIKVWNIKTLFCLQTLMDRYPHRPENIISAIYFDGVHRQLLTGSNKLESWPLYSLSKHNTVQSHDSPIVTALFNHSFHQIVSGCEGSIVSVWDVHSGEKTFQFSQVHGNLEITAMTFDLSGRRLVTASRDGVIKMWNFNNGQLLARFHKNNDTEVSAVVCAEIQNSKYIIAVGWDLTISIFLDNPEVMDSEPIRELYDPHRGHSEDILCLAFVPPYYMATGDLGGTIVLWNLEANAYRSHVVDPFANHKSPESKAVEDLCFIYDHTIETTAKLPKFPLISCHADGFLRVWDIYDAILLFEFPCWMPEAEGLTSLALDLQGRMLLVGGSLGHVRVFELNTIPMQRQADLNKCITPKNLFRCHVTRISSLAFISNSDMLLTSSSDCTIRLWKVDGTHVGIFGQEEFWDLSYPNTYSPIPLDVKQDRTIERRPTITEIHSPSIESLVDSEGLRLTANSSVESALGTPLVAWTEGSEKEASKNPAAPQYIFHRTSTVVKNAEQLRIRALQLRVVEKWKEFTKTQRRRSSAWQVDQDLLHFQHACKHFSYSHSKHVHANAPKVKIQGVKPEAVYKELARHTKYELEEIKLPEKPIASLDVARFYEGMPSTPRSGPAHRKKWEGAGH